MHLPVRLPARASRWGDCPFDGRVARLELEATPHPGVPAATEILLWGHDGRAAYRAGRSGGADSYTRAITEHNSVSNSINVMEWFLTNSTVALPSGRPVGCIEQVRLTCLDQLSAERPIQGN